MSNVQIELLIFGMSEILGNIYTDRAPLIAFVKHILSQLYSHWYSELNFLARFGNVKTFVFLTKFFFKILVFFIWKTAELVLEKSFINQEWLAVESCLTPRVIKVYVLLTGLQYTLSIEWPDFGLELCQVMPKRQKRKVKVSVCDFPIFQISIK